MSSVHPKTDGSSASALADTGEGTFSEEVDRHIAALYRFALLWHEDATDAEDLVVESVVASYRIWHAFSAELSPRLRFFSVLRGHLEPQEDRGYEPQGGHREDRGADAGPPPGRIPGLTREEAVRALRRLPPRYREILVLKLGGGLRHREIAQLTGDDPRTLRKELKHAREALQRVFAPPPGSPRSA